MTFTQVTVKATYTHPDGTPASGTVTFTPNRTMTNSNIAVSQPVSATLDSSGSIAVQLAANDDAGTSPAGGAYWVAEGLGNGLGRGYSLTVPASAAAAGLVLGGALAAAGGGAGTSPPAPLLQTTVADQGGSLTFGTGTTPSAGAQVAVTFPRPPSVVPVVVLCAGNAAAAALQLYVTSVSAAGFTIASAVAPAASQAASVYAVSWALLTGART